MLPERTEYFKYDDILSQVCSHMDIIELGRMAQVSKVCNAISSSDASWKNAFCQIGLPYPAKELKEKVKKFESKVDLALLHADIETGAVGTSTYKLVSSELLPILKSDISIKEKLAAIKEHVDSLDDRWEGSIMHSLAQRCGSIYAFELLLEMGINIETKDSGGSTPLELACYRAYITNARLFLQYGAKVTEAAYTMVNDSCIGDVDKNIEDQFVELLDGKEPPFIVPLLTGEETDQEIVNILYKMPKEMRRLILHEIRQRPDYQEICPFLLERRPGTPLSEKGSKILADATRTFIAANQK